MYKLFTDKSELFECDIKLQGASLNKSKARLVVETPEYSLLFKGTINSKGKCEIPIRKLKGLIDENTKGNIRLEVIAEDTFFTPWESDFEVETTDYSLLFKGEINSKGKCEIPIRKLKGLIDEDTKGNIRLEVIAEDTYFTPWESDFEVETSKKVTVEVKSQQNKKPILETKVKVKVKKTKPVTLTEKQHVINLFKLLIKEDININNISFKRNKLNNIVATYLKENTIKNKNKVINSVLKVLETKK